MPQLELRAILGAQEGPLSVDIRDLEIMAGPGGPVLISAGGTGGGLMSFDLSLGGTRPLDSLYYSGIAASGADGSVDLMTVGGTTLAVFSGLAGAGLWGAALSAAGGLGAVSPLSVPALTESGAPVMAETPSGFVYLVTAEGTLRGFRGDGQGGLAQTGAVFDGDATHLSDPVALATAIVGGREFVLSLCRGETGVSAFSVDAATGQLAHASSIGVQNGLGLLGEPTAIETAAMGGQSFVIVASAAGDGGQGGALSVMTLSGDGTLVATDHVLDTLETRFGQIQSLSIVESGGWVHVVAAGGDGGVSLFTLLPDGRLHHLDTMAATLTAPLTGLSAVAAARVGDTLQVLAAGQDAPGIVQLGYSLAAQGAVRSAAAGRLDGTGGDDLLAGGVGDNDLRGGAGDDLLTDGMGTDRLTGGAGADTFLLEADGARDVIADFQPGQDRIDLSLVPMLYSASQIEILTIAAGALLRFRGEETEIRSAGGGPLTEAQIRAALDWGTGRVPMVLRNDLPGTDNADRLAGAEATDILRGFAGDDMLEGFAGDDVLRGGDGADTIYAGEGADVAEGDAGRDVVFLDAGDDIFYDLAETGPAGSDMVFGGTGNDLLLAEGGDDTLYGGDGADTLQGGEGQDWLYAGAGDDQVLGGVGPDRLWGGPGADQVLGGDGNDQIAGGGGADVLRGELGNDTIWAEFGNDLVAGGAGADRLWGGPGNDTVTGGDGNDRIAGGTDNDRLDGEAGNDTLFGEGGDDLVIGGAGNDLLWGGGFRDTLEGGIGDDELHGTAGFDLLFGGDGNDRLYGGIHGDTIDGGAGDDLVFGGFGQDLIRLGSGNDIFYDTAQGGTLGQDTVFGGDGQDTLRGGMGSDQLQGDDGDDLIEGGWGNDTLIGGTGNDRFVGGLHDDVLTGGAGADTFVFGATSHFDRITDFDPGIDRLHLVVAENNIDALDISETAEGLLLSWTGGRVLLMGLSQAEFRAEDVEFF